MAWWWSDVLVVVSHPHHYRHHLDALLLALASSTDNFTVGLSVGIRQKKSLLPTWANGCISVCNAAGAWVAGHGGVWVSLYFGHNNSFPLYLSAIAFGGLALSEYRGYREEIGTNTNTVIDGKKNDNDDNDDDDKDESSTNYFSNSTTSAIWPPVLKLAVPMTLNNLAGGVAGGAAGLTPQMSAFYALVASFVTMFVGHRVGRRVGSAMNKNNKKDHQIIWLHPSLLSALLLGILCLLTLQEAIFGG
jgi:putative Mn2+ efflux pump MntP